MSRRSALEALWQHPLVTAFACFLLVGLVTVSSGLFLKRSLSLRLANLRFDPPEVTLSLTEPSVQVSFRVEPTGILPTEIVWEAPKGVVARESKPGMLQVSLLPEEFTGPTRLTLIGIVATHVEGKLPIDIVVPQQPLSIEFDRPRIVLDKEMPKASVAWVLSPENAISDGIEWTVEPPLLTTTVDGEVVIQSSSFPSDGEETKRVRAIFRQRSLGQLEVRLAQPVRIASVRFEPTTVQLDPAAATSDVAIQAQFDGEFEHPLERITFKISPQEVPVRVSTMPNDLLRLSYDVAVVPPGTAAQASIEAWQGTRLLGALPVRVSGMPVVAFGVESLTLSPTQPTSEVPLEVLPVGTNVADITWKKPPWIDLTLSAAGNVVLLRLNTADDSTADDATVEAFWKEHRLAALPISKTARMQRGRLQKDGKEAWADLGEGIRMEFIWCPPGTFQRGSSMEPRELLSFFGIAATDSLIRGLEDEVPQHEVTLTQGFWLGRYEVTLEQFAAFIDATGYRADAERGREAYMSGGEPQLVSANWRRSDRGCPVVYVSWNDAAAFCNWLEKQVGLLARLPTGAEWEYACRAGSRTIYNFGDHPDQLDSFGWFQGNSSRPQTVGQKRPNAWGFYDMYGNVWEWCRDWSTLDDYRGGPFRDPRGSSNGTFREIRGGSCGGGALYCRSATRWGHSPYMSWDTVGFRVCVLEE